MKKRIYSICIALIMVFVPKAGYSQSAEVVRMMDYIVLAEQAGLDVELYLMELSDQLAMASATQYMDKEILEQGEAAARLYAHPLVCMNYAACLMKQLRYGDALRYLAMAWHQDKQNYILATDLARCHFELGDEKLANAFLDRALSLAPDYGLALQLKATLLLTKGDQESKGEAVGYVMRSALDVWNHLSVRHFNSLAAEMEKMFYAYRDTLHTTEMYPEIVKLSTPVDGYEDLFVDIAQAGQEQKPNLNLPNFTYPIPERSMEADERYIMSIGGERGLEVMLQEPHFLKMLSLMQEAPSKSHDYPVVYSGLVGGYEFLPDSRAFNVGMVAYFYHQIKLLEAEHNLNAALDRDLAHAEKRMSEGIVAIQQEMQEGQEFTPRNFSLQAIMDEAYKIVVEANPYTQVAYGKRIYGYAKEYVSAAITARIDNFDRYMYEALNNFQRDIKTALYYIVNEDASKYLQSHYDSDMYKYYYVAEAGYFSQMAEAVNGGHLYATFWQDLIDKVNREEREYLDRTRDQRVKDWEINQNLKAAGMEDIGKYPVPMMDAAIGGLKLAVGVDHKNRIHLRVDDAKGAKLHVINPETGASSSAILHEVKPEEMVAPFAKGRLPHDLPDNIKNQVDLPKSPESLGGFDRGGRMLRGKQIVKDARGNIIESSFIAETTQKMPSPTDSRFAQLVGGKPNSSWKTLMSPSIEYYKRDTKAYRLGSSIVSTSSRNSVSFGAGFGLGSLTIGRIGAGFK